MLHKMFQRRCMLKAAALGVWTPAIRAQAGGRIWLGPEYWANPMQDWRTSSGRIECHVAGAERNVYWLTKDLGGGGGGFTMSVKMGSLDNAGGMIDPGWAGFRVGAKGYFKDYRDTVFRGRGLHAGITGDGRLFIGKPADDAPRVADLKSIDLKLEAAGTRLTLTANGQRVEREVPADWLVGMVALVCHSGRVGDSPTPAAAIRVPATPMGRVGTMRFWFEGWKLTGPKVADRPERAWGPVLFVQYTLSRGVMKMTAQLAPCEGDEPEAELLVGGKAIAKVAVDAFSSTASFRVANWNDGKDAPYEVVFKGHRYKGVIRRDPRDKSKVVVGALTCQGDFGFPHADIAKSLTASKPDILFFTGDQIYEANGGYGIQRAPIDAARTDYLRKWYMFGWAWGELTRNTPCVCLPDDHDVYHGNLWGAAGRKAEYPSEQSPNAQMIAQDSGGYAMPARWVNMVQRTQSSHLPDAWDKELVDQDITVHFCHLVCGGVSFAVLEDRKWKSAPKTVVPDAKILNGFPQNPAWDASKSRPENASLLGPRQEKFLEAWAQDWDGVSMKSCVSATIFSNLATLPKTAMNDNVTNSLPVQPLGGYAPDEKPVSDHDSNAWPQPARDRATYAGRQRARQDRAHSQRDDLVPPFRHHRAQAADHDPQTAEIRETAQRICQDRPCPGRETVRRQTGEIQVGDKLVQHGFAGHQHRGGLGFRPGNADQPHDRAEGQGEDALQRHRRSVPVRQQRQAHVQQRHQRHGHQQGREDCGQDRHAVHRSFHQRVDGAAGFVVDDEAGLRWLRPVERHHQRGDRQRGGGGDHRRDQDVAQSVGHDRRQERGVDDHDGTGDSRHAARHQGEQLPTLHAGEIWADQQRCLDHADEDMDRGAQGQRAADAEDAAQHAGENARDGLQNAPMEQQ